MQNIERFLRSPKILEEEEIIYNCSISEFKLISLSSEISKVILDGEKNTDIFRERCFS